MNSIEKLIYIFTKFPGIGPRQAARFAYYLVDEKKALRDKLVDAIAGLENIRRCNMCFRAFEKAEDVCSLCQDRRDRSKLAIVEKDVDLDALEKIGIYNGGYFILGGSLSMLNSTEKGRLRTRALFERVKHSQEIKEIILATSTTTEGEFTARYIEKILEPLQKTQQLTITRLGRGLSTGAELEYLNRETLKNALDSRK